MKFASCLPRVLYPCFSYGGSDVKMELLYEIAILLIFAFLGSMIASKLGQNTLLGYIIVGMLIGPNIHISFGGIEYNGLLNHDEIIQLFSEFGVMLLLFFVGLDFSVRRLMQSKNASIILALSDIGLMLFIGFVIGAAFSWPFIDTFFLACIIGMSSVAVTAKIIEGKKMNSQTRDTLVGMMLIEDMLSIILVIITSSIVGKGSENAIVYVITGLIVLFVLFIILYVYVVPFIQKHLHHLREGEIMGLFAITMVFLGGIVVLPFGLSPLVGAFFIGLAFSETRLKKELETHLTSFKHIFVAIFFLAFGMMISPAGLFTNLEMIVLAIIGIFVGELFVLSAIAYIIGLQKNDAFLIGSGAMPRSEEAVIFANIGLGVKDVHGTPILSHGATLYPLTGAICFLTTLITPAILRINQKLTEGISKILPEYLKYSGSIIARTLKRLIFPQALPIYRFDRRIAILLGLFLCVFVAQLVTSGIFHTLLVIVLTPLLLVYITLKLNKVLSPIIREMNYFNLGMKRKLNTLIQTCVSGTVVLSFLMLYFVSATWAISWILSLLMLLPPFIVMNVAMYLLYKETTRDVKHKGYLAIGQRHSHNGVRR